MPRAVLLVDDSEDDVFFISRAFKEIGLISPVIHVDDGDKAIDYLTGAAPYHDRTRHPFPGLVVLDLKMPRVSGFEVIQWVRTQSDFSWLPMVVLSSSHREPDVVKAYACGTSGYLVKPSNGNAFLHVARVVKHFWLDLNITPMAIPGPNPLSIL